MKRSFRRSTIYYFLSSIFYLLSSIFYLLSSIFYLLSSIFSAVKISLEDSALRGRIALPVKEARIERRMGCFDPQSAIMLVRNGYG
jgi:hypothetical protein